MPKVFDEAFNRCSASIPFNPLWANGTGYFDGASVGENAPSLPAGYTVTSVDPTGRRMMITSIGSIAGISEPNVVIFERYSPGTGSVDVLVSNAGTAMCKKYPFLSHGRISDEDFSKFHQ